MKTVLRNLVWMPDGTAHVEIAVRDDAGVWAVDAHSVVVDRDTDGTRIQEAENPRSAVLRVVKRIGRGLAAQQPKAHPEYPQGEHHLERAKRAAEAVAGGDPEVEVRVRGYEKLKEAERELATDA